MHTVTRPEVEDGAHRFVLPSGHVTLIDAADLALVKQYRWFFKRARGKTYVHGDRIGEKRVPTLLLHRVIMAAPEGLTVDHRNGDGLDNRRANLRLATHADNARNVAPRPSKSSPYKGVFWDSRTQNWRARLQIDGRKVCLGRFDDAWEAAEAYNAAALEAWGEFAWLNQQVAS